MRVNITVSAKAVTDIEATANSVDAADFADARLDPEEVGGLVCSIIQDVAQKARARRPAKERPASAVTGRDYPLDPEQD